MLMIRNINIFLNKIILVDKIGITFSIAVRKYQRGICYLFFKNPPQFSIDMNMT